MINKEQTIKHIAIMVAVFFVFALVRIGLNALSIRSITTGNDGMKLLYVPEAEFTMGAADAESHEQPIHVVNLDDFWIDQTEVTNKMYSVCVDEGVCVEPIEQSSFSRPDYYGNAEFDNYPVINVDWNMAKTYCEWAGRRLPTEAEWEKAARGTDERTYPWGEELVEGAYANFNNYNADTTIVGKYEDGKSPYGAYDMAGNVWEWVNDWYGSTYYQISPLSNPLGPDSGNDKVLRGGTWDYDDYEMRSANRSSSAVTDAYYNIGFRCASSQ